MPALTCTPPLPGWLRRLPRPRSPASGTHPEHANGRPRGRVTPCRRLLHLCAVAAAAAATGCGTGAVTETVRRAQRVAVAAAIWQQGDVGGTGLMSAEHRGTSLTVDEARRLARNPLSIFVRDLVTLEPPAAEALAATRASLHFDRLASLSADAARALASHRCLLRLDAVAELDPEAAAALAEHAGTLSLDGLTHLDGPTAGALGRHRGQLSLNGLEELSVSAAEGLADHDGDLCLNSLRELAGPAARALARHRHALYLVDVVHLDDDAIDALAGYRGRMLTCGPDVVISRRWMTADRRREELRRHLATGDQPARGGGVTPRHAAAQARDETIAPSARESSQSVPSGSTIVETVK